MNFNLFFPFVQCIEDRYQYYNMNFNTLVFKYCYHDIGLCFVPYFSAESRKMFILKVYVYLPCINTQRRATSPFDDTPVISPLQRKHWTTWHYHVYLVYNLLSYGELSSYVLLLRFGLSHWYNTQDNTAWLFFIVLQLFRRFCEIFLFYWIYLLL